MAKKTKPVVAVAAPPPPAFLDLAPLIEPIAARVAELLREQAQVPPPPTQAQSPDVPTWMTSREAAALLRVKPATLEIWRMKGKGPTVHRIGRNVRYRRAEVDAFARDGQ